MSASLPEDTAFAGYVVIIPAICIFGITGNILTLIVLIKGQFQGVAFVYLKGLAIYDMLGLLFILPICFIRCPVCNISSEFRNIYIAYMYIPVGDIFLKASIVTTVVLTIERSIAVCFVKLHHLQTKHTSTALLTVIAIGVVSALENLPTFWQIEVTESGNVEVTEYAKSEAFIIYGWFDAVLFQFLPMLILFVFNIIMILYLRSHRQVRKRLEEQNQTLEQRFQMEQKRIIIMLVGIIILFLVTMVPSSVMLLIGFTTYYTETYLVMRLVSTVLTSLNFACNFLLYCTLNKHFWKTFKTIVCCQSNNKVHPEMDVRFKGNSANIKGNSQVKISSNQSDGMESNRPVGDSVLSSTKIQCIQTQEEIMAN